MGLDRGSFFAFHLLVSHFHLMVYVPGMGGQICGQVQTINDAHVPYLFCSFAFCFLGVSVECTRLCRLDRQMIKLY